MNEFFSNLNPFVLCIPLISSFIGWFTNWLAVKATLYPVKFVGIPPIFGWQGVIPKSMEEMAESFSELIGEKLVDIEKLFSGIEHDENEELDELVEEIAEKVLEEFSTNLAADKWDRAGDKLKNYIRKLVRRNVRQVVEEILNRLGREAKDFMDIRGIAEEEMMKDRGLLGQVLWKIANPEFKFIEISGLWFGLLFGFFQMLIWIAYPVSWVLPAAGFFVGATTNWMALNLIFEPRNPIKIGPFVIQGLFIKRQKEVAEHFADEIVDKLLTGENLIKHMTEGPSRGPVLEIVESQVDVSMKEYERDTMVAMLVPKEKMAEAKADLKKRIHDSDLGDGGPVRAFADQSDRIHAQIKENIHALDADEFGGVLRTVFQKDEWKLVLVGGVIGIVIGALQVVYLFGGAF